MGKEEHQPASLAAHHLINQLSAIVSHCDLLIENAENGTELSRRLHAIRDIASEAITELREYQRKRQAQSVGWKAKKTRKPYEKPTVTKLTPEEAEAKLLDAANKGDQGAKSLLELMSHEGKANDKKKSA
jgi:Tfp pilus assembly protein PilP